MSLLIAAKTITELAVLAAQTIKSINEINTMVKNAQEEGRGLSDEENVFIEKKRKSAEDKWDAGEIDDT